MAKRKQSEVSQMIAGAALLGVIVLFVCMFVLFFWRWFLS